MAYELPNCLPPTEEFDYRELLGELSRKIVEPVRYRLPRGDNGQQGSHLFREERGGILSLYASVMARWVRYRRFGALRVLRIPRLLLPTYRILAYRTQQTRGSTPASGTSDRTGLTRASLKPGQVSRRTWLKYSHRTSLEVFHIPFLKMIERGNVARRRRLLVCYFNECTVSRGH